MEVPEWYEKQKHNKLTQRISEKKNLKERRGKESSQESIQKRENIGKRL